MQIKGLHKNVYKLYGYARTQECLDAHRRLHEERVAGWRALKREGVSDATCQRVTGVSRSSYYRSEAALKRLAAGKAPPSKARKRQNKRPPEQTAARTNGAGARPSCSSSCASAAKTPPTARPRSP